MAGRKPLPTNIKLLRGNPGHRPLNESEPQPPVGPVEPPAWLRKAARKHWDAVAPVLVEMKVLTSADATALALMADAISEYLSARRRGKAAQATEARKFIKGMLAEFGMTPSSRSRIHAVPEGAKADDDDRYFGN